MRMLLLQLLPLIISSCTPAQRVPSCLDDASVRQLDAGWERAYLERDVEFLDALLADDFIWVHTHASSVDSKEILLRRISASEDWVILSRAQSDVEVRRLGTAAVVTGFTVVTRRDGSTRYAFMRTYVTTSGECVLLANQTMAIPEE